MIESFVGVVAEGIRGERSSKGVAVGECKVAW